jgi:outer membrane protein assembly factor BamB
MTGRMLAAAVLVWGLCVAAGAADKGDKKTTKDERAASPAELFTPSAELKAKQEAQATVAAQIEAELAARAIALPPEMALDVDWYSPFVDVGKVGKLERGWVVEDVVLLETNKRNLVCMRRADGVTQWICELSEGIRYMPAVSRNNVVVNVNNTLVAVHKQAGFVRWRLMPNFVMSCAPLVVDPPAYPASYKKEWQPLEHLYVGGWDGRFYAMTVRGRLTSYTRHILPADNFSAPEFDLFYNWHKTHKDRGLITGPIVLKDQTLYYAADNHTVCAVSREGVEREPYYMLGVPVTNVTVMATPLANVTNSVLTSVYVGGSDASLYCLDRLTLKKKWADPAGHNAFGSIMADDAATPYVYYATRNNQVRALQIQPARASKGQPEIPESFSVAWSVPEAQGAITAGPDTVYLGTGRAAEMGMYTGIIAVEKATGKTQWRHEGKFLTQYLEFHNSWSKANLEARVFALTADNRLVSLKEKIRDTGLKVVKVPAPDGEAPKMPIRKKGAAAPAAEGAAAPAAEEKKAEEKKE